MEIINNKRQSKFGCDYMARYIKDEDNFLMSPKNDFAFKMLFGDDRNKEILIAFLNSVLNEKIQNVVIVNNELHKEYLDDRQGILDVRGVTDAGINIDIEIQLLKTKYMPERTLYYWAKMYIEQLNSGEKFSKLKKTITINILDFNILPIEKYHNLFHIIEDEVKLRLTDVLEIHFLEMPKLHGNKHINENDNLTQWMMFLDSESKEGIEMLAEKNNQIKKAYDILQVMSKDKAARALYLAREMALHDEATRLEEAEERGKAEGIQQGIQQGIRQGASKGSEQRAIEIAKKLIGVLDDEIIAEKTGLTIETVKELKQNI